jgi:hypothetical protein
MEEGEQREAVTPGVSYRSLIGDRAWREWTVAIGLARLPVAMAPLALVVAGRYATGSFADGSLLAGAHAFAESLAAPWQGRWLDRRERRSGLRLALMGACVALTGLLLGTVGHAPFAFLLAATIAAAAAPAAVQGGLRAFLPHLVGERAPLAFALDASMLEVEWLAAPALVALAVLAGLPYLAVAGMLATTAAALTATCMLPRLDARPHAGVPGAGSPWGNPAAIPSYLMSAILGYTEGTVTITLAPLLVALHARAGLAGLLLAGLSASSAIGGVCFGRLSRRLPGGRERQANLLIVGLGLLALPVALAPSAPAAAVAVAAFGLLIAPVNGLRTQLLAESVPATQHSEAFAILYSAMGLGWGASGLIAGVLLRPIGAAGAIAIAAAVAVSGGVATQLFLGAPLRRRYLTRSAASSWSRPR